MAASFDIVAKFYDFFNPILNLFYKKIIPFLQYNDKSKILDVGCGTGEVAIRISNDKSGLYGIDLSERMIDLAQKKSIKQKSKAKFIVGNASSMPFKSNFFDLAYSTLAFHHMPKEEVISEMYRVLKKGGALVVADFFNEGFFGPLIRIDELLSQAKLSKIQEFKKLLVDAGFKDVQIKKIHSFFYIFTAKK